jgi:hypothetical protein
MGGVVSWISRFASPLLYYYRISTVLSEFTESLFPFSLLLSHFAMYILNLLNLSISFPYYHRIST